MWRLGRSPRGSGDYTNGLAEALVEDSQRGHLRQYAPATFVKDDWSRMSAECLADWYHKVSGAPQQPAVSAERFVHERTATLSTNPPPFGPSPQFCLTNDWLPERDDFHEVHLVPANRIFTAGETFERGPDGAEIYGRVTARRPENANLFARLSRETHLQLAAGDIASVAAGAYFTNAEEGGGADVAMFRGPYGPMYVRSVNGVHRILGAWIGAPEMALPAHVDYEVFDLQTRLEQVYYKPPGFDTDWRWLERRDDVLTQHGIVEFHKTDVSFGAYRLTAPMDSPLRRYPWMLESPHAVATFAKAYRHAYPQFGTILLERAMLNHQSWMDLWR